MAIKLETFIFPRYGMVNATVDTVTRDAVNDERRGAIFPAMLKFNQTHIDVDGKRVKLAPGDKYYRRNKNQPAIGCRVLAQSYSEGGE